MSVVQDPGDGLVIVAEQIAEFGGVERIIHTLMSRYPQARVVAGRFDASDGLCADDFERRATALGIPLKTVAGERRLVLFGSGGPRSQFLSPVYARRLRAFPLEAARTVLSLGATGWTIAARIPEGAHHVAYIGGPPRALYDHTNQYVGHHARPLRGLLRASIPGLRAHHRRLLRRPHRLVTNASWCARGLAELAGRDVSFVYPPVRTSFFTPLPRSREHFLAVSRLFGHKRIDVILEAFRTLPEERLVVAGSGPALSALRAAAPPNVIFAGSVGDAELLELYRSSRALVTASVEEFGLSTAEALATGTAVVGPRAGGTGEIVDDGQTGVLFDQVKPGSVAAAIRRAMEREFDPAACRRSAERFSEERFVAELEPILRGPTVSPSRRWPPASPPPALRSRA